MVESSFWLSLVSDKFWNLQEFVNFLATHQHQSIVLRSWPEAPCLQSNGVYKLLDSFAFEKVTIHTNNPLATCHPKYSIKRPANWLCHVFWLSNAATVTKSLHEWNQKKIFLCLFARPTAPRLAVASHLLQHLDHSHVHFNARLDVDQLQQFDLNGTLSYNPYLIESVGHLIKKLPLLLESPNRYSATNGYDYKDPLTTLYRDILIDVVVESHIAGHTFFPTEKTLRPMWLKKPFIVFASANYLEYLRQMGFRTFSDFWSEDYDGYEKGDRLSRILMLLDQLMSMSRAEHERMYWDMQYTLEHNYSLLKTQLYKQDITPLPYDG